tara:strand:- start:674 stop:937 length:264 start_codon:yes stop_codon:yes gene_type:complete
MAKAEEILEKHLAIMDAETMIGKHGRTHKAVINAINEAINYSRCSSDVVCGCYKPNVDEQLVCDNCDNTLCKEELNEGICFNCDTQV